MFCQVIVDIVHENVASPFTYRIPDMMILEPGQRVAVPFGPGKRKGSCWRFLKTAIWILYGSGK